MMIGLSGSAPTVPRDLPSLAALRGTGGESIARNYRVLSSLLETTEAVLARGETEKACVFASIAAFHGSARHCGVWASPELEGVLRQVAQRALPSDAWRAPARASGPARRICHVATAVQSTGGLSRMLSRWIETDRNRQHDVVLTRQSTHPVPDFLVQAIGKTGGQLAFVDGVPGGILQRADRVRRIARRADVVVLHIHSNDVVPIIALAAGECPPAIYLDHADHSFWLGTTVCEVIASMRQSGRHLAIERRGVDPARIAMLPTILEAREREMTRVEAKRRLGLPEHCILLLSVARARKFRPLSQTTYADLHLCTLIEHPNCFLVAVGPGATVDWSDAIRQTAGRVIALPEQDDPSTYFQAADIYVDSFPFVSITSILEAASYGAPAVSLFPYSDDCAILGSDMPGLDRHLLKCRTLKEYTLTLSRLISDESRRLALGRDLAQDIALYHRGDAWLRSVNDAYDLAFRVPPMSGSDAKMEPCRLSGPDPYIQAIHGGDPNADRDTDRLLMYELGLMPVGSRLREWWRLLRKGQFKGTSRYGPMIYLLPDWLRCRLGRLRRRHASA